MCRFAVLAAVLGMFLLFAGPAMADGYGHHGGYPHHDGYYHGYYGYHGGYAYPVYAPPVYQPQVVYPAPWVVPAPVYGGYYSIPGPSVYLQGRNFSLGIGF